jgi:type II secretory pathway component PulK
MNYFTVCGDGKINLNTAGVEVLSVLPDIDATAAEALVGYRYGPDGQPFTEDDQHLENLDVLKGVNGITEHQAELLKEYGTLKTQHFRVTVEVRVRRGGRPCRLSALVRRDSDGAKIVWLRSLDF